MNEEERRETRKEIEEGTMKFVRRLGYVVFFGAAILLVVPMLIAGVRGIQTTRIWDPMTGERVSEAHMELNCLDDAQDLLFSAGQQGQWTGPMEQRYRLWLARCRSDYPQAYDMLNTTRTNLQTGRKRE